MWRAEDKTPRLLDETNKHILFVFLFVLPQSASSGTFQRLLIPWPCLLCSSPCRILVLNSWESSLACFTVHQTDTKAHSCLRVAPFIDTEQLPIEFIIVQRLPSLRLTGGNEATVGCFKHDINIQIDAWLHCCSCSSIFFLHYVRCALFSSHDDVDVDLLSDNKQRGTLKRASKSASQDNENPAFVSCELIISESVQLFYLLVIY